MSIDSLKVGAPSFEHQLRFLGLTTPGVIAAAVGFIYTVGYLVNAITLRNYGVQHFEAVKPQYLEVGITFILLLLMPALVAISAYWAHFKIRRASGLPNYRIGATGYALNTYHIFILCFFFGFFMTENDFLLSVHLGFGIRIRVYELTLFYAIPALLTLVMLPVVERIVAASSSRPDKYYMLLIEPLRWGAVAAALAFDTLFVRSVPWIIPLVRKGLAVAACAAVIYLGGAGIYFWFRKVGRPGNIYALAFLGALGCALMIYITVNAYVWAIVRAVPMNRGGKLPLTRTYLYSESIELTHLRQGSSDGEKLLQWGPVFLVEESADFVYVTRDDSVDWLREWVPIVAVRKAHITHMVHERVKDGAPRIPASSPM